MHPQIKPYKPPMPQNTLELDPNPRQRSDTLGNILTENQENGEEEVRKEGASEMMINTRKIAGQSSTLPRNDSDQELNKGSFDARPLAQPIREHREASNMVHSKRIISGRLAQKVID